MVKKFQNEVAEVVEFESKSDSEDVSKPVPKGSGETSKAMKVDVDNKIEKLKKDHDVKMDTLMEQVSKTIQNLEAKATQKTSELVSKLALAPTSKAKSPTPPLEPVFEPVPSSTKTKTPITSPEDKEVGKATMIAQYYNGCQKKSIAKNVKSKGSIGSLEN